MRAAIYARVSTEEQAQSVDVQESDGRRFAASRGWQTVDVYRDEGVSGADFVTRPGLLRMLRDLDARPRPWDVLVVRDLDRLGRDQAHTVITVERILRTGAKLYTYSGAREVTLSPLEKAMLGVQVVFAEFERAMIVGRVRGSHEYRAREGLVTGGVVYGYDNVRRPDGYVTHAINDDQAAIVRELYARRAQGESIRSLVLDLNRRRVPSPSRGQRGTGSWSPSAVHEILHRERYRGVLEWGRTRKGYTIERRKERVAQADADVIRVERADLAIIDAETWERVRARDVAVVGLLGARPRHLLVGHVRCAVCGGPLAVVGTRRGRVTIDAYTCGWARDRGPTVCGVKLRRPVEELDADVTEWMEREALSEASTRGVLVSLRALLERRAGAPDADRAAVEAELAAVERERDRLARALAVAGDVEALAVEIRARDDRARTLRATLAERPTAQATLGEWDEIERDALAVLDELRVALANGVEGARKVLAVLLRGTRFEAHEVTDGPRRRYTLRGAVYLPPGALSASPEGTERSARVPIEIRCGWQAA